MPPETTQSATPSEPAQAPAEPQSAPIVNPVGTQATTEPLPVSTAVSETPIMPPVAPESPTSPSTPALGQTSVSAVLPTEPQTPPLASTPAEPTIQPQTAPEEQVVLPQPAPVLASIEPPPSSTPPPAPAPAPSPTVVIQTPNPRSLLAKALSALQFRKTAKLEKIMKMAQTKKTITNDQVEKLLHVSDATATRYLSALVKQGKLKQIGVRGSTHYEIIQEKLSLSLAV